MKGKSTDIFNKSLATLLDQYNKPGTPGQASNGIQEHYVDRSVSK